MAVSGRPCRPSSWPSQSCIPSFCIPIQNLWGCSSFWYRVWGWQSALSSAGFVPALETPAQGHESILVPTPCWDGRSHAAWLEKPLQPLGFSAGLLLFPHEILLSSTQAGKSHQAFFGEEKGRKGGRKEKEGNLHWEAKGKELVKTVPCCVVYPLVISVLIGMGMHRHSI